jgi:hypothetical protein
MKLTPKQEAALLETHENGKIFQTELTPVAARHAPSVLASLVKHGLLHRHPVGCVWTLPEAGREAVTPIY